MFRKIGKTGPAEILLSHHQLFTQAENGNSRDEIIREQKHLPIGYVGKGAIKKKSETNESPPRFKLINLYADQGHIPVTVLQDIPSMKTQIMSRYISKDFKS